MSRNSNTITVNRNRKSDSFVLKNEDAFITSLISGEVVQTAQVQEPVDMTSGVSMSAFVAAFTRHLNISEQ